MTPFVMVEDTQCERLVWADPAGGLPGIYLSPRLYEDTQVAVFSSLQAPAQTLMGTRGAAGTHERELLSEHRHSAESPRPLALPFPCGTALHHLASGEERTCLY